MRWTIVAAGIALAGCARADRPRGAGAQQPPPTPASRMPAPTGAPAPLDSLDWVLGSVHVGGDSLSVARALGRPDSVSYVVNPFDPAVRLERWDYPALTVHYSGGAEVGGLVAHGPGFATRRGVHVGDAAARVTAAYGAPSDTTGGRWTYCEQGHDDCLHQLYFEFSGGSVSAFFLGWALD